MYLEFIYIYLGVFHWNYALCLNYTHIYSHDYTSDQSVSVSFHAMLNNSFKMFTHVLKLSLLCSKNISFFIQFS